MTPIEHAQKICAWFIKHAITKYMKGQEEHGGRLWRKPVWKYLRDEIIDMPIYFQVLEEQQTEIELLLGDAVREIQDWKAANPSVTTPKFYDNVIQAYNLIIYGNIDGEREEEK